MKQFIIIFIATLLFTTSSFGQQDAMYTQYNFNQLIVNPAYAGSTGNTSASLFYRNQWLGIEGAPETFSLSVHSPFKNNKVGLGLTLESDKIGLIEQYRLSTDYSYHIRMNKGVLSLGVKGMLNYFDARYSQSNLIDDIDPVFSEDVTRLLPNVGFGAFYYAEQFYIGISAPHVLNNKLKNDKADITSSRETRHYYMTGGYVFNLSNSVKLKPSILVKIANSAPIETDISATFFLKDVLGLGVSYRTNSSINGLISYQVSNMLKIGYAYDYSTTVINQYTSGSHEIMLGLNWNKNADKIITPRFF